MQTEHFQSSYHCNLPASTHLGDSGLVANCQLLQLLLLDSWPVLLLQTLLVLLQPLQAVLELAHTCEAEKHTMVKPDQSGCMPAQFAYRKHTAKVLKLLLPELTCCSRSMWHMTNLLVSLITAARLQSRVQQNPHGLCMNSLAQLAAQTHCAAAVLSYSLFFCFLLPLKSHLLCGVGCSTAR